MVKKLFLIIISAIIALLVFAPKENLYFLLEQEMEKNGLVLSDESIDSNPIGLKISDAKVYLENTYIGDIKSISILTLLLYSNIEILEFNPIDSIKKMLPLSVSKATIVYGIWNPLKIDISIDSTIGKIKGDVDLSEHKILLRFDKDAKIDSLRGYLRKDETGWYYEQSF